MASCLQGLEQCPDFKQCSVWPPITMHSHILWTGELLCGRADAGHLEGKADGKGHKHDRGALRVLHTSTAPAAWAEGRPAGASRALTVLAAQERNVTICIVGARTLYSPLRVSTFPSAAVAFQDHG